MTSTRVIGIIPSEAAEEIAHGIRMAYQWPWRPLRTKHREEANVRRNFALDRIDDLDREYLMGVVRDRFREVMAARRTQR